MIRLVPLLFFFLMRTETSAYWQLQWADNSTDESGFRVERKIKNQAYTQIGQTVTNVTTYDDLSSVAGTQYCYRIITFNQFGSTTGPQTCAKQPR